MGWDEIVSWDDNTKKDNKPKKKEYVRFDTFLKKTEVLIDDINNIGFGLPKENEQIRIITQQRFNAFALLKWLISSLDVNEILLSSYRIDKLTVLGIERILQEEDIKKIVILLGVFFTSTKRQEPFAEMLIKLAEQDNRIKLIFCRNHTKIIAVKSKQGYYIIEGSGNLTGNSRLEQYMIEKSEQIYKFHSKWMNEITEENAVIINN